MPITLTEADLRRMFPRARAGAIDAILDSREFIEAHGLLDNALRWAHFAAQIAAETDQLRIGRENMSYSAARIVQIFGARRHSAKVSRREAEALAFKPYELAERVYGLGNPSMARRLGNRLPGDGFKFRGGGPGQVTGRGQWTQYTEALGLDVDANPELLDDFGVGLKAFVLEWEHRNLNAWADRNQGDAISKGVNLGDPKHRATPNGLDRRRQEFARAWAIWRAAPVAASKDTAAAAAPPADLTGLLVLRIGDAGAEVAHLQERLRDLGYHVGHVDKMFGAQTRRAVVAFQADANITIDGIVGPATWAALRTAEPIEWGEREAITASDLAARGSETIATAQKVKRTGLFGVILGFFSVGSAATVPASILEVSDWVAQWRGTAEGLSGALSWALTPLGAITLAGVLLLALGGRLWWAGAQSEARRTEEARTGANLAR